MCAGGVVALDTCTGAMAVLPAAASYRVHVCSHPRRDPCTRTRHGVAVESPAGIRWQSWERPDRCKASVMTGSILPST